MKSTLADEAAVAWSSRTVAEYISALGPGYGSAEDADPTLLHKSPREIETAGVVVRRTDDKVCLAYLVIEKGEVLIDIDREQFDIRIRILA